MKRERQSLEEATRYGFRWDQLDVVRAMDFRGTNVVSVETEFDKVQIYVSPTGRSVRVFRGGNELKEVKP